MLLLETFENFDHEAHFPVVLDQNIQANNMILLIFIGISQKLSTLSLIHDDLFICIIIGLKVRDSIVSGPRS